MLIQTILVYTLLTVLMYILCQKYVQTRNWNFVVWAIIAYALVFGVRYGVGIDAMAYMDYYNWGFTDEYALHFEPGFRWLGLLIYDTGVHYSVYFGILAFIQVYVLAHTFKDKPNVLPYFILVFMLFAYWLTFCNGLRQITAFSSFAFSVYLLDKKEMKQSILFLLVAFSMHTSAFILLPVYIALYLRKEWFKNIKLQLLIFVAALIVGGNGIVTTLMQKLDFLIIALRYEEQADQAVEEASKLISVGIGYYVNIAIKILLILFSNKVKCYFSDTWLPRVYNLFFIGAIFQYLFMGNMMLGRMNYYFIYFQMFVMAFTLYYFYKKNVQLFYSQLVLMSLIYVATLSKADINTAMYYTFWQKEEYKMYNSYR